VGLGAVGLDDLAKVHDLQPPDHKGAEDKADDKGGQSPVYGAEGNIPENIENGIKFM
jgi:hypothetical protein